MLRVTLSDGLVVPNVVGRTLEEAKAYLGQLGWTVIPTAPAANSWNTKLIKLQHPAPGLSVDAPGEIAIALGE